MGSPSLFRAVLVAERGRVQADEANGMPCFEMTAAQGTPNRGKRGKSINLIKFDQFLDFSPKWSWGPLDRLKILS